MAKYFAVIYLKNGNIDWSRPLDTPNDAMTLLREVLSKRGQADKVKATTVCKREVEGEFLFGHPMKYDLMQAKDFGKDKQGK